MCAGGDGEEELREEEGEDGGGGARGETREEPEEEERLVRDRRVYRACEGPEGRGRVGRRRRVVLVRAQRWV